VRALPAPIAALDEAEPYTPAETTDLKAPKAGSTVLHRVHHSMILFAVGRGEALEQFLAEE
jgi:hypothetical protein